MGLCDLWPDKRRGTRFNHVVLPQTPDSYGMHVPYKHANAGRVNISVRITCFIPSACNIHTSLATCISRSLAPTLVHIVNPLETQSRASGQEERLRHNQARPSGVGADKDIAEGDLLIPVLSLDRSDDSGPLESSAPARRSGHVEPGQQHRPTGPRRCRGLRFRSEHCMVCDWAEPDLSRAFAM